jgi:hypothetical protein
VRRQKDEAPAEAPAVHHPNLLLLLLLLVVVLVEVRMELEAQAVQVVAADVVLTQVVVALQDKGILEEMVCTRLVEVVEVQVALVLMLPEEVKIMVEMVVLEWPIL